jgi:hypothetical protein
VRWLRVRQRRCLDRGGRWRWRWCWAGGLSGVVHVHPGDRQLPPDHLQLETPLGGGGAYHLLLVHCICLLAARRQTDNGPRANQEVKVHISGGGSRLCCRGKKWHAPEGGPSSIGKHYGPASNEKRKRKYFGIKRLNENSQKL